jgi:hypothetical protein
VTRRVEIAVGTALAASFVLNVYLVTREPTVTRVASSAARTATIRPPPVGAAPPSDLDATRPCADQLADVEARLAVVLPELEQRLTPKDRFEDGEPAPDLEAETKPLVDKAFADRPAAMTYTVTCQGRVCRVWITGGKGNYRWDTRLQESEFRSRWSAVMFYGTNAYVEKPDE